MSKQITIWKRWDDKKKKFMHNHIEDGHSRNDLPTPIHEKQRSAWDEILWEKSWGFLKDGKIIGEMIMAGKNKKPTNKVQPKFDTSADIVKDPAFRMYLSQQISKLHKERLLRKPPKPGYYYKRDWFDRMVSASALNSKFFLDHIEAIWEKKSSLNAEFRMAITEICNRALRQTLAFYAAMAKEDEVLVVNE